MQDPSGGKGSPRDIAPDVSIGTPPLTGKDSPRPTPLGIALTPQISFAPIALCLSPPYKQRMSMDPKLPAEEQIRARAHEIYLARGSQPGHEKDDWLQQSTS